MRLQRFRTGLSRLAAVTSLASVITLAACGPRAPALAAPVVSGPPDVIRTDHRVLDAYLGTTEGDDDDAA